MLCPQKSVATINEYIMPPNILQRVAPQWHLLLVIHSNALIDSWLKHHKEVYIEYVY